MQEGWIKDKKKVARGLSGRKRGRETYMPGGGSVSHLCGRKKKVLQGGWWEDGQGDWLLMEGIAHEGVWTLF